uniref:Serpentine receptor class gamma n=1 Tax=Caenorhabditis tropicalis TaxID=1561998 RepID=A0A1I7TXX4_9PELO
MTTCYKDYWLNYEKVTYSATIILSLLLSVKLFVWNKYKKQEISKDLKRANRLALIDTFVIIVFDLIPPILVSTVPNFYYWLGPVNTVFKTFGFVIEGFWNLDNLDLWLQATYFPILFFKYRKLVPSVILVCIISSYLAVDSFVMFGFCGNSINVPRGCVNMMCALSLCYQEYWMNYEKVVYSLIIILSLLLSLKLFVWNKWKKQKISRDLRRANRLALLDTLIIIVFDLTPPILLSIFPDVFSFFGPINAFFKTLGFVIESRMVSSNLRRNQKRNTNQTKTRAIKSVKVEPSDH